MITLTYKYHRDVFIKGGNFKPWVKKILGDDVIFNGFSYGMSEPSLVIRLSDFEKVKDKIQTKNLIKIRGFFGMLEQLCFGVRCFENKIKATE